MNVEIIKSTFQAIVSQFVAERDATVANINQLLYSKGDNVEALTELMSKLTLAKMNIANTQEELNKAMTLIALEKQTPKDNGSQEPEIPSGNRPE